MSTSSSPTTTPRRLRRQQRVADVELKTTVPETLAAKFDRLVAIEHSTTAAVARRLIAIGIDRELAHLEGAVR